MKFWVDNAIKETAALNGIPSSVKEPSTKPNNDTFVDASNVVGKPKHLRASNVSELSRTLQLVNLLCLFAFLGAMFQVVRSLHQMKMTNEESIRLHQVQENLLHKLAEKLHNFEYRK